MHARDVVGPRVDAGVVGRDQQAVVRKQPQRAPELAAVLHEKPEREQVAVCVAESPFCDSGLDGQIDEEETDERCEGGLVAGQAPRVHRHVDLRERQERRRVQQLMDRRRFVPRRPQDAAHAAEGRTPVGHV